MLFDVAVLETGRLLGCCTCVLVVYCLFCAVVSFITMMIITGICT